MITCLLAGGTPATVKRPSESVDASSVVPSTITVALATGSSDYHGTGKLDHDLGCHTTDPEVFNTLMDRLAARRVS